ncbi:uncharacterized protein LOC142609033 [Castanea sativa]|uniref:uncharacterized protein LOC142609033 n=1 Tax=Castanea sativa TaxID=21020 RepID=UPI003F64D8F4
MNDLVIGFSEENARRLHHPHDDVFVISTRIGDYNIHKVLIHNGSSVDILYYSTFQQIRIGREWLISTDAPLVGFGGTRVYLLGEVTLPITVGDYPQQIVENVTFLVVDCSFAYNAILGHPTLNSWKAVTSTYHLMVKFPTEYEVGEVKSNQVATRECYIATLEMDDHLPVMCIEEWRTVAKPIEGIEEVHLDNTKPERTTKIGNLASLPVHQALMSCLRDNQDVFACSHEDMLRIDPSVFVHKLNVSPSFSPVR